MSLYTGKYEVRLARSKAEIEAAQALRFQVFCHELGASPSSSLTQESDQYDAYCDHLVVIDREKSSQVSNVVGTYRLLRKEKAKRIGGFYSEQEFDLDRLLQHSDQVVEMGRSCVSSDARSGVVISLLWRGIAEYIELYKVKYLFGCASFQCTDPKTITDELCYLYRHHLAPESLRPKALDDRHVEMNITSQNLMLRKLNDVSLPPLIKGYLRAGSYVGDGAVIDHQFKTTDICIVLDTDRVSQKYHRHFQQK